MGIGTQCLTYRKPSRHIRGDRAISTFLFAPSSWPAGQSERLISVLGSLLAPGRPASAAGAPSTTPGRPLISVLRVTPRPQAVALFVASSSATACAPAAPALLLRPRDRPRPAFIGSTKSLPLRWSSPWAPGIRPSLAAPRQLRPATLNCVADPATGFMPELPGRSWPLPLRRLRAGCAIAPPELLIVFVFRLRPGLPARASGLPLRWGSAWGSGSAGLRRRRTVDYPRPPLNISASCHAPATSRGSVRGLFKCDGLRAGCACATLTPA